MKLKSHLIIFLAINAGILVGAYADSRAVVIELPNRASAFDGERIVSSKELENKNAIVEKISSESANSLKYLGGSFLYAELAEEEVDTLRKEGYGVYNDRVYNGSLPRYIPNDPLFAQQWHLDNFGQRANATIDLDAPEAWAINPGSRSIVIAMLDSGINTNLPELRGNMWTNPFETPGNLIDDDNNGVIDDFYGYDAIQNDGDPRPNDGHGNATAGILAPTSNNNSSAVGGLLTGSMMAVRVLSSTGGTLSTVLSGINYVLMMKARGVNIRIINASFGQREMDPPLYKAIKQLNEAGILFVAAAGNGGENSSDYPAAFDLPNVVSVAAVDGLGRLVRTDQAQSFNTVTGPDIDIAAPGFDVRTGIGSLSYTFGTSVAAPLVTAAAALVLSAEPELTSAQVIARLKATSMPYDLNSYNRPDRMERSTGIGIVNFCAIRPKNCRYRVNVCNGKTWGDVNRDGESNSTDIKIAKVCLGAKSSNTWNSGLLTETVHGGCQATDVDASGEVDKADLDIIVLASSQRYCNSDNYVSSKDATVGTLGY